MDSFTRAQDFARLGTEYHSCFTVRVLSIERSCHSFSPSTLNIEILSATSSPKFFPFLLQVISWSGDDALPQVPGCLSWHLYSTAKSANSFLICVSYSYAVIRQRRTFSFTLQWFNLFKSLRWRQFSKAFAECTSCSASSLALPGLTVQDFLLQNLHRLFPTISYLFLCLLTPLLYFSDCLPSAEVGCSTVPWIAAGALLNIIAFTTFSSLGTTVIFSGPLCTTAKWLFHMRSFRLWGECHLLLLVLLISPVCSPTSSNNSWFWDGSSMVGRALGSSSAAKGFEKKGLLSDFYTLESYSSEKRACLLCHSFMLNLSSHALF